MARLAGQRNTTRNIATAIMGNSERIDNITIVILFISYQNFTFINHGNYRAWWNNNPPDQSHYKSQTYLLSSLIPRQSQSEPNTGLHICQISLVSISEIRANKRFSHTIHKFCESVKVYLSDFLAICASTWKNMYYQLELQPLMRYKVNWKFKKWVFDVGCVAQYYKNTRERFRRIF